MKNHAYLLIGIILLLTLTDCKKGEDVTPTEQVLVKMVVDVNYPTSKTDDWVIVHDTKGSLLGYKKFEGGDNFVVKSSNAIPENKLSITLLSYDANAYNGKSFVLRSYFEVDLGMTFNIGQSTYISPNLGAKIGEFSVNLVNVENMYTAFTSDNLGRSGPGGGWSLCNSTTNGSFTLDIYDVSRNFFFYMADQSGNIGYKFLQNVKDKDKFNITSLSSLTPFDNLVNISFPATDKIRYTVMSDGYITNSNYLVNGNNSMSSLKLGYPSMFSQHYSFLQFSYNGYSFFFEKKGGAVTKISWPSKPTIVIQNKAFNNFNISIGQPFNYRTSSWGFSSGASVPNVRINWIVYSPKNSQGVLILPAEFSSLYPELKSETLTNHYSTYFRTQSQSYSDFINSVASAAPIGQYEETAILIEN